jgi:hypothetical protein
MNEQSKQATPSTEQLLHRSLAVELSLDQLGEIAGAQTGRYYFTGCGGCGDECSADYGRDND